MPPVRKQFRLRRVFALASLVGTLAVGAVIGILLSQFFVHEAMRRDALLTNQFVQTIANTEIRHGQFDGETITIGQLVDRRLDDELIGLSRTPPSVVRAEFYDHLSHLPDALLVHVFARDHTIVWSTNPDLIGTVVSENAELQSVFAQGEAHSISHTKGSHEPYRPESLFTTRPPELYVESYLPLKSSQGDVVAVVEVYKEPQALLETMHKGYLLVWLAATLAALFIFATLFWIVHRAAMALDAQEKALIENETLVAIGEMSSAVAHGLRNPLAAIRSSAELAYDSAPPWMTKTLDDIVAQVDKLSSWVHELLVYSRPLEEDRQCQDLAQAVREALDGFAAQFARAGIEVEWVDAAAPIPSIVGHHWMLSQVLHCVLANAVEAMPKGGKLGIRMAVDAGNRQVVLQIDDTGVGMTATQLREAFKPFRTTKRSGLGVGLSLTRRIMERLGGSVSLSSLPDAGVRVELRFMISQSRGAGEAARSAPEPS